MKTENESLNQSGLTEAIRRFTTDRMAVMGLIGICLLLVIALYAPLLANGRPLVIYRDGSISFPAVYFIFAPDANEQIIEKLFNYLMVFLPLMVVIFWLTQRRGKWRLVIVAVTGACLLLPFLTCRRILDKTDWRSIRGQLKDNEFAVFAPIPYNANENVSSPYEKPSLNHYLGTDSIGRDLLSRMIYGARISLAVGLLATFITLLIGIVVGMTAGYFGGKADIIIMRFVEIIICFPMFLFLLILMVIMMEMKFRQSVLIVIFIIGITGWTGLCRLVRGEVLKLRNRPYIQSCVVLGIPVWRIMRYHLLPNISGIILVNFTFSVAGAILTESALSFLGFGVQPPTASWGELLRQAFADPQTYWNLVLWPGLALFTAVSAFNFAGEGLRRLLNPKA